MGYGFDRRPPMPDRFVTGSVATPRNAWPRKLGADIDGSIGSSALTDSAATWSTDIVFSRTDYNTVAWSSGTITFASGITRSIDAGNTGNMTALTWIYFDATASPTVLQTTTDDADLASDNVVLMCTAQNAGNTNEEAFMIPVFGALGVAGINIGANSITTNMLRANSVDTTQLNAGAVTTAKIDAGAVDTNELAAGAVTATKIDVSSLSAISADVGTITAGYIKNSGNTAAIRISGSTTLPSSNYIDFTATGNETWLKTGDLTIQADGDATFGGTIDAATGYYSGALKAANIGIYTSGQVLAGIIDTNTSNFVTLEDKNTNTRIQWGTTGVLLVPGAGQTCQVSNGTFSSVGSSIISGSSSNLGFFSNSGSSKQTVTGATRDAAFDSLLTALVQYNLIADGTTY